MSPATSSSLEGNEKQGLDVCVLARSALLVIVWIFSVAALYQMLVQYPALDLVGVDAHAYWAAVHAEMPYAIRPGYRDAYLYSPAFLQAITPLAHLPWRFFFAVWMAVSTLIYWWLLKPLPLRWRFPLLLMCMSEILYGNIYALLALVLCLGVKRPGLWAFAILTKITIGVVGIVWFAARRDWKALWEVTFVTGTILTLSLIADHTLWIAWYEFLTTTSDGQSSVSRMVRLIVVVLAVAWAAKTDREWLLPLAMFFALPRFSLHLKDFAVLSAIPRLWTVSLDRRRVRSTNTS